MSQRTVIIADDHPLLRAAVAHALSRIVPALRLAEAGTLKGLQSAIQAHPQADLVLLDLHMPGAHGFSSLFFLRGEHPAVPVVIISSSEDRHTIRRAHRFGAAGFIPKSASVETIVEAVRSVLDGNEWFPHPVGGEEDDDSRLAARMASLTPQQWRVLMCIADGMPNKHIADELKAADNTIKVHVTAVLRKLGVHSRTQAALLARSLEPDNGEPGPAAGASAADE